MHVASVDEFNARLQNYTFQTVQIMMLLIVNTMFFNLLLTSLARDTYALDSTKVEEVEVVSNILFNHQPLYSILGRMY